VAGRVCPVWPARAGAGALNGDLKKALQAADLKAALAKVGVEPRGTSPDEGAAFLRAEFDKWKQVITDGKIKEN
jgi:tripartite-type tricarboxylate transporter receptor subunit TctC